MSASRRAPLSTRSCTSLPGDRDEPVVGRGAATRARAEASSKDASDAGVVILPPVASKFFALPASRRASASDSSSLRTCSSRACICDMRLRILSLKRATSPSELPPLPLSSPAAPFVTSVRDERGDDGGRGFKDAITPTVATLTVPARPRIAIGLRRRRRRKADGRPAQLGWVARADEGWLVEQVRLLVHRIPTAILNISNRKRECLQMDDHEVQNLDEI